MATFIQCPACGEMMPTDLPSGQVTACRRCAAQLIVGEVNLEPPPITANLLKGGPRRAQTVLVCTAIFFIGAKLAGVALSWWWLLLVIPLAYVARLIDFALLY